MCLIRSELETVTSILRPTPGLGFYFYFKDLSCLIYKEITSLEFIANSISAFAFHLWSTTDHLSRLIPIVSNAILLFDRKHNIP